MRRQEVVRSSVGNEEIGQEIETRKGCGDRKSNGEAGRNEELGK